MSIYAQYPCKFCGHEGKRMLRDQWICGMPKCINSAFGDQATCRFCKKPSKSMINGVGVCAKFNCAYQATQIKVEAQTGREE